MKNMKCMGEDRRTTGMLKNGGEDLATSIFLNKCLRDGQLPTLDTVEYRQMDWNSYKMAIVQHKAKCRKTTKKMDQQCHRDKVRWKKIGEAYIQ